MMRGLMKEAGAEVARRLSYGVGWFTASCPPTSALMTKLALVSEGCTILQEQSQKAASEIGALLRPWDEIDVDCRCCECRREQV